MLNFARRAVARAVTSDTHQIFEAAAMRAVAKDLLAMKVTKLKEELEARGEGPRASLATRRGCGGGCTRRSSARAS